MKVEVELVGGARDGDALPAKALCAIWYKGEWHIYEQVGDSSIYHGTIQMPKPQNAA